MSSKSKLFGVLGAATALIVAATPNIASAQQSQAAPRADDDVSAAEEGELIVTGTRRIGAVNDIPATIDVIGGDDLQQAGAIDSITLQNSVPGLQISRETGLQTQIYLRGIGNNITGLSASNSVATYVDGVYVSNNLASFQRFNDVQRLEVLRGPQAVLYGRNATGGAVLLVSRAPTFDYEFSADASIGNFNAHEVRATISGPLVGDTLAGRLSFRQSERDGYMTNLTTGQDVDREEVSGVRGALLWEPNSTLAITLRADYTDSWTADYTKVTNPDSWEFTLLPGDYSADPWSQAYTLQAQGGAIDQGGLVNVSWSSPIGDVTSVTSYRDFQTDPIFTDLDGYAGVTMVNGAPFLSPLAQLGDVTTAQNFWHETFIATDADAPVSLVAGFNYSNEDSTWLSRRQSSPTAFSSAFRISEVEAASVFADATWNITDRLQVGAGVRYSHEDRSYSNQPLVFATGAPTGVFTSNSTTYNSTNPRFGIQFRRTPGELWYLSYQTGFKSGGFNETNPLDSFDPEEVTSYEFGLKRTWLDGNLQTNLSIFSYDYTDLQVQRIVFPAASRLIDNSDSADIQGIDLDITARLSEEFTFGAKFEYLDTAYGDLFLCNDLIAPCTIGGVPNAASNINAAGNQLARAPELSAVFSADWEHELSGDRGTLGLHLDTKYTSRTYFSPYEAEVHSRDPFWVLSGEARWAPNERYYVALFGQNLTDELYEQLVINSGNQYVAATGAFIGNAPHYVRWAPPRTYGIRVGVNF